MDFLILQTGLFLYFHSEFTIQMNENYICIYIHVLLKKSQVISPIKAIYNFSTYTI